MDGRLTPPDVQHTVVANRRAHPRAGARCQHHREAVGIKNPTLTETQPSTNRFVPFLWG